VAALEFLDWSRICSRKTLCHELVNSSCISDGISYLRVSDETLDDAGYNKWFPDKPDFLGNCGILRSNSLLGNTYCNEKLLFICELNK